MLVTLRYLIAVSLLSLVVGCNSSDPEQSTAQKSTDQPSSEHQNTAEQSTVSSESPVVDTRYQSIAFSVSDISEEAYQGRISAAVTFSNPVPLDQSLSEWLKIETQSGEVPAGSWVANKEGSRLFFPGLEPETAYRITVMRGLPSQLGKKLEQDVEQELTTAGVTPMLGFVSQGHFLAHKLTDGLPVISVNAHQVDVDFYRVPQQNLVSFLSEHGRGKMEFWRLREQLPKFELAYTARFDLEAERNEQAKRFLPISDIQPLQTPGVYVAVMHKAGEYLYEYPATWFAVTDLGVHMRVYKNQMDVMVNSLATADGVPDVELSLLDGSGKALSSARTSPDGVASLSSDDQPALLMAVKGGDTTLVRLQGPSLDLSEFPVEGIKSGQQSLFLYASRDLYRPGEQVSISGLLRSQDGTMVPSAVLTASLRQPNGRVVSEQRLAANDLNYYEANFHIASDAPTGEWRVSVQMPDQTQVEYPFWVEDFLPERMTLDLDGPQILSPADQLAVKVEGDYLYGAPAAGNKLQSRLITSLATHPFENFSDYHFGDVQDTKLSQQKDLPDLTLDDEGRAVVSVPAYWEGARSPVSIKLFESLLDTGGRPISRSFSSTVMPESSLLGIRPMFSDDTTDYGANAVFELIFTDGDKKLANAEVEVKLVREHRRYYWVYSDLDGWTNSFSERHYPVFQQSVEISEGSVAQFEAPVEWGFYRVEAKDLSTGLISSYRFRAGWSEDSQTLAGRPDRIGMSLDKKAYQVGDTAVVSVQPPAAGKGYLLVEAESPLYWQPIEVGSEGGRFEIPVKEEWQRHDLYISTVLIQPGQDRDELLPRRMMGIHPLKIDREARRLEVEILSDHRAFPEQNIEIPVKVSSSGGTVPKKVQLTLSAVDLGILNISQFETPDPFEGFFGQRRYQVESRDNYGQLIESGQGKLATLRFGGDADLERGGNQPASDVQIISLFSGVVDVDESGVVNVPVYFPDFNGRVRLMAVAFAQEQFGSDDEELQVAAPVVTQLTTPRFLAYGDESRLALDLHNLSGRDQTLDIELTLGDGLEMSDGQANTTQLKHSVALAKDEKKTFQIPVRSTLPFAASSIDLNVTGLKDLPEGASTTLNRRWTLGSRPAWSPVETHWHRALEKDQTFRLPLSGFDQYQDEATWLTLNVSSLPPLDIAAHLRELKAYPYGCLEQTTSGVFASLYADDDLLSRIGVQGESEDKRNTSMNMAIQRLLGMQKPNGSFGLWNAQSPEEYWLTVYVADFLLRARTAGYSVPEDNLQKVLKRLQNYLRNPGWINSYYGSSNQALRFSVQAYAGQVLARIGQAPLSDLRTLYDNRKRGWTGLGLTQLSLALEQAGDRERAKEAMQEASSILLANKLQTVDYGSHVRDLALALFWTLEAKQPVDVWEPLLYQLSDRLKKRQWLSTQERNALFLAGWKLQDADASDLDINIMTWDDQAFIEGESQFAQQYPFIHIEQGLSVENLSDQPAFLSASLSGYTLSPPDASSRGVNVKRRYLDMKGKEWSAHDFTTGDMLLVELTVQVDESRHHIMVVDLLPAGLELENQNLATSFDLSDIQVDNRSIVDQMMTLDIRHQEFRGDRYVAAIDMGWNRQARLYYLARAVSPGVFTIPPTFAEDMYHPEIRHIGPAEGRLSVAAE